MTRRTTRLGRALTALCLTLCLALLGLGLAGHPAWSQVGEGGSPGEMEGVPGGMEGVPGEGGTAGAMEGEPGAMEGTPGATAIPGQGGTPGAMEGTPGQMEGTPGATPGVRLKEDGTKEQLPAKAVPGHMKGTPGATPGAGAGTWTLTHLLWGIDRLKESPNGLSSSQKKQIRKPVEAVLASAGLLDGVEDRFGRTLNRKQRSYLESLRKAGKLEGDPAGLPSTATGQDPLVTYVLGRLEAKAK